MMFYGAFLVLEVRDGNRKTMVVSAEPNESAIGTLAGAASRGELS
jgi:hypothetical protein